MSLTTHLLRQVATKWAVTGYDAYGKPTFGTPVALSVAWEHQIELVRTKEGKEVVSTSRVFLTTAVAVGDYLFLGASVASDPTALADTEIVLSYTETTDQLNGSVERVAYL